MNNDTRRAAEVIADGGTVLCLTDTIWGISGDARSEAVAERIAAVKQRPEEKSFIVLVDSFHMLDRYASHVPDDWRSIMEEAERPTTLILPDVRSLAPSVYAADGTVGVRRIRKPDIEAVIAAVGHPIISTSANISGQPHPRSFAEVDPRIRDGVDLVLEAEDDGNGYLSRPSRILKWTDEGRFDVLRD